MVVVRLWFYAWVHFHFNENEIHDQAWPLSQIWYELMDLDGCRRLPYQEKHAVQQASLLGNLEAYGLLEDTHAGKVAALASALDHEKKQQRAIVELGAGRGYLSQMLCDCYSVNKVLMVERRSYKFKVLESEQSEQKSSLPTFLEIQYNETYIAGKGQVLALATKGKLPLIIRFWYLHASVNVAGRSNHQADQGHKIGASKTR